MVRRNKSNSKKFDKRLKMALFVYGIPSKHIKYLEEFLILTERKNDGKRNTGVR